jgi:hypothetical protein
MLMLVVQDLALAKIQKDALISLFVLYSIAHGGLACCLQVV